MIQLKSFISEMLENDTGAFTSVPELDRCCYCTKKLRVACVIIAIWIMFAGAHGFAMCVLPSCQDMFSEKNRGLVKALIIIKGFFFTITLMLLISDFFFLMGILKLIPHRAIAKDVLFVCGFLWTFFAILLAILELVHMRNTKCFNHNDIIACFMYSPCMIYFMLIVNSFRDLGGVNDTVLPLKAIKPVPRKEKPPVEPKTKLGKCLVATLKLFRKTWQKIKRIKTASKTDQKTALTPANATALTPEDATALTPADATALTPENATALTPADATAVTPEDVTASTPEDVTALTPEDETVLTLESETALTDAQADVTALTPESATTLTSENETPLTPENETALTPEK